MKYLALLLSASLFLPFGHAMEAGDKKNINKTDPINIEFDANVGFSLFDNKIVKFFSNVIDMGKSLFGYDSKAYVDIKNKLKSRDFDIELIVSILLLEKYPNEENMLEAYALLMEEIKLGKMCKNMNFENNLNDIVNDSTFSNIFENMKSLYTYALFSIRNIIIEREIFIHTSPFNNIEEEAYSNMTACFLPMLKHCKDRSNLNDAEE